MLGANRRRIRRWEKLHQRTMSSMSKYTQLRARCNALDMTREVVSCSCALDKLDLMLEEVDDIIALLKRKDE